MNKDNPEIDDSEEEEEPPYNPKGGMFDKMSPDKALMRALRDFTAKIKEIMSLFG